MPDTRSPRRPIEDWFVAGTPTGADPYVNTWTYEPAASATFSIPPRQGIAVGWFLFWRSVGLWLRRQPSVDFEMHEEPAPPFTIELDR